MKKILFFLILIIISTEYYSQVLSVKLDSLTRLYIKNLSKNEGEKFKLIIENKINKQMNNRVDSLKYDVAYIEQNYCFLDSTFYSTERFYNLNDTVPNKLFLNGNLIKESSIYIFPQNYKEQEFYKINCEANYRNLKPNQRLNYDKIQLMNCIHCSDELTEKFTSKKKEELKNTIQIQTMIDKTNKKVIVSVQNFPRNPRFEIQLWNAGMSF